MARYPAQPLEEKLAWMRERQRERRAAEEAERIRPVSPRASERRSRLDAAPPVKMYRLKEVADMLGVSLASVRRHFAGRWIKFGHSVLISQKTIDEVLGGH